MSPLVVPTLDNYRLTLLSVNHAMSLYPATVSSGLARRGGEEAADYDDLLKKLESFLSDKVIKDTLVSLLAQTKR